MMSRPVLSIGATLVRNVFFQVLLYTLMLLLASFPKESMTNPLIDTHLSQT